MNLLLIHFDFQLSGWPGVRLHPEICFLSWSVRMRRRAGCWGCLKNLTVWKSWDFGCWGENAFGKCFVPAGAAENQWDQNGATPEPSLGRVQPLCWAAQASLCQGWIYVPEGRFCVALSLGDDYFSSSFFWTEGETCEGPSPEKQTPEWITPLHWRDTSQGLISPGSFPALLACCFLLGFFSLAFNTLWWKKWVWIIFHEKLPLQKVLFLGTQHLYKWNARNLTSWSWNVLVATLGANSWQSLSPSG